MTAVPALAITTAAAAESSAMATVNAISEPQTLQPPPLPSQPPPNDIEIQIKN